MPNHNILKASRQPGRLHDRLRDANLRHRDANFQKKKKLNFITFTPTLVHFRSCTFNSNSICMMQSRVWTSARATLHKFELGGGCYTGDGTWCELNRKVFGLSSTVDVVGRSCAFSCRDKDHSWSALSDMTQRVFFIATCPSLSSTK